MYTKTVLFSAHNHYKCIGIVYENIKRYQTDQLYTQPNIIICRHKCFFKVIIKLNTFSVVSNGT